MNPFELIIGPNQQESRENVMAISGRDIPYLKSAFRGDWFGERDSMPTAHALARVKLKRLPLQVAILRLYHVRLSLIRGDQNEAQ